MQNTIDQTVQLVGNYVPSLLGAVAILVLGWLIALVVSALVRGALRRTHLDNRLASVFVAPEEAAQVPVARYVGKGVFYVIMLFVVVAFFQALQLTAVTGPLNGVLSQLMDFVPRLLGAAVILLIAVVIATVVRKVATTALGAAGIDERLGGETSETGAPPPPISRTLGEGLYWLILFLFLPAILGALALEGLLAPVQNLLNQALAFLPKIVGAALILVIGWFIASLLRRIVTNLLVAVGVDRLADRMNLNRAMGAMRLSGLLGLIVYVLVLVPVIVAALNALELQAVTEPASNMLAQILRAVPALLAAGLLLGIAYIVGRLVASIVSTILTGAGFDRLFVRLGLADDVSAGQRTPSYVAGALVLAAIMLFAAVEAARLLEFTALAVLLANFLVFAGQILMGLIVFAIGLYLANLAAGAIRSSDTTQAGLLALAARVAILVLAGAMALRQMGLANEIINLAFGLLIGSIAVAVALAFGLGAREVAGRTVESWTKALGRPAALGPGAPSPKVSKAMRADQP